MPRNTVAARARQTTRRPGGTPAEPFVEKLPDEKQAEIERDLNQGMTNAQICAKHGVSLPTLHRFFEKHQRVPYKIRTLLTREQIEQLTGERLSLAVQMRGSNPS